MISDNGEDTITFLNDIRQCLYHNYTETGQLLVDLYTRGRAGRFTEVAPHYEIVIGASSNIESFRFKST